MTRTFRMLLAVLPPLLAGALLCISPSRALAGVRAASRPATPESARNPGRAPGLGSADNPIPVAGTETHALILGAAGPRDRIALRIGSLRGWLLGTPGTVLSRGGGPDPMDDPSLPVPLNVFSGGAIETAVGRSSGLYLEGGRVLLRDPIDVIGWGGSTGEYWTSSAGFAVRF